MHEALYHSNVRLPPLLITALLGLALALTLPPLPTGLLTPIALAALLWHVSQPQRPKETAGRMLIAMSVATGIHLSWLVLFLGNIFGAPPLGALALALYALEGGFYALVAYLVAQKITSPQGRLWGLAGGWIILEALRFLGPFAFPWPTLGYSLLPTPLIQIADIGGVLLVSVLIAATAAALAHAALAPRQGRGPLGVMGLSLLAALAYGLTRTPADGPEHQALLIRSDIPAFAKAEQSVSPAEQFALYNTLSSTRTPTEVVIWPETAVQDPSLLPQVPEHGIYGLFRYDTGPRNQAVGWNGQTITATTNKARPVPFGEYFPLRQPLAPVWNMIEGTIHQSLQSTPAATTLTPLPLGDVQYGAYVCYDSVFPWAARQLTNKGANVLLNVSNDGWFASWGVAQHFWMGRVRAIENRRWVLRSVNEGIAGSVDDLGRPVETLNEKGALHVRFRVLSEKTIYNVVGDWPALLLALLLIGYGFYLNAATISSRSSSGSST